jgi:hypothetical protein
MAVMSPRDVIELTAMKCPSGSTGEGEWQSNQVYIHIPTQRPTFAESRVFYRAGVSDSAVGRGSGGQFPRIFGESVLGRSVLNVEMFHVKHSMCFIPVLSHPTRPKTQKHKNQDWSVFWARPITQTCRQFPHP